MFLGYPWSGDRKLDSALFGCGPTVDHDGHSCNSRGIPNASDSLTTYD